MHKTILNVVKAYLTNDLRLVAAKLLLFRFRCHFRFRCFRW
jgi:hypothetical protein